MPMTLGRNSSQFFPRGHEEALEQVAREAVEAPILEVFKARLDEALSNLV